jgi:ParB/RepB/Spo0J family partition protein
MQQRTTVCLQLAQVRPDPGQPRKNKPSEYIMELGNAINERRGTERAINPITVRRDPENPEKFIIVQGECRYLAHLTNDELKEAGNIEAFIRESELDEKTIYLDQIGENVNRLDMGTMETIRAYHHAISLGATIEEVAKSFGKTVSFIQDELELIRLPDYIQNDVDKGGLPKSVAKEIAKQPTDARMGKAYKHAKKGKNATEMLAKIKAYVSQTQQKTMDEVFATVDTPPEELKKAGKRIDALMQAVSSFARDAGDKGGLIIKARSRQIARIEETANEMIRQAKMLLDNARIYRAYTVTGEKIEPEEKMVANG